MLPFKALYPYGTFIIGVGLIAFLGFVMSYAFGYIAAIGYKTSIDLGTNSTETEAVNTFFNYVSLWIPIFMLIVLGIWVIVYTQKKGGQVYGEL